MRFATEDAGPVADNGGLFGMKFEKADVLHLAQTALFGLIGIVALLLVLRPMVLRITSVAPGALEGRWFGCLAGARWPGYAGDRRWSGRRQLWRDRGQCRHCWKTKAW